MATYFRLERKSNGQPIEFEVAKDNLTADTMYHEIVKEQGAVTDGLWIDHTDISAIFIIPRGDGANTPT